MILRRMFLPSRLLGIRFGSGVSHIYKEEYLKVAREWPHEYFHPSHFEQGPEVVEKMTPEMLALIDLSSQEPDPQTFNSVFWTRILSLGVAVALFYRTNEYLTRDGKTHPATEFIGTYLDKFDGKLAYEQERVSLKTRQQQAYDQLIFNDRIYEKPKVYRLTFPDTFHRASDFIIPVGSQINLDDLEIKHTWQEDDDLYAPQ